MVTFYQIQQECEQALEHDLDVSSLIDKHLKLANITFSQAAQLKEQYCGKQNCNLLSFNKSTVSLKNIKDFKPKDFICKRLQMNRGNLITLIAAGASGKSMLLQYFALCVATGTPLFNTFEVKKSKVLHIDQEQSENQTNLRYCRIAKGMNIPEFDLIDRLYLKQKLDKRPDLMQEVEDQFVDMISEYDLVIIDSLKKISCAEENSDKIEVVINMLKQAAERVNCVIMLIHHKGKGKSDVRQSGRGHSSIYDGVDIQIDLDHEQDSLVHDLKCAKNRDGRSFDGIKYEMVDGGNYIPAQDCYETLVFNLLQSDSKNKLENSKLNILQQLSPPNTELNQKGLFDLVKGDRNIFDKAILFCLDNDLIKERTGERKARLFSITTEGLSYLSYDQESAK